jgi:hypothetical protein
MVSASTFALACFAVGTDDTRLLLNAPIEDGLMQFTGARAPVAVTAPA